MRSTARQINNFCLPPSYIWLKCKYIERLVWTTLIMWCWALTLKNVGFILNSKPGNAITMRFGYGAQLEEWRCMLWNSIAMVKRIMYSGESVNLVCWSQGKGAISRSLGGIVSIQPPILTFFQKHWMILVVKRKNSFYKFMVILGQKF